jgi:hypothetical protein
MGYPTRIQMIKTGGHQQWLVNFPVALAQAMGFSKSEMVEWEIVDRHTLKLKRRKINAKSRK